MEHRDGGGCGQADGVEMAEEGLYGNSGVSPTFLRAEEESIWRCT